MDLGYAISSEEHRPLDIVRHARRAEEAGSRSPWSRTTSILGSTGRGRARSSGVSSAASRRETETLRARHRSYLPDDPHPSRDRRAGRGDCGRDDAWSLLPRRRHRREPERAHPRRPLALGERAPGDARGGRRAHARALGGRADEPSTATTTSSRTRGSTRFPTSRSTIVVAASAPEAAELAGRIGDGLVATAPEAELVDAFLGAGGERAALRPAQRLLGGDRGGGTAHRARGLAERGPRGAALAGARCCRATSRQPSEMVDRGRGRRDRRVRARSRAASRGDPEVPRRGVRPRLRAPGRARPGRVLDLLRARGLASARTLEPAREQAVGA